MSVWDIVLHEPGSNQIPNPSFENLTDIDPQVSGSKTMGLAGYSSDASLILTNTAPVYSPAGTGASWPVPAGIACLSAAIASPPSNGYIETTISARITPAPLGGSTTQCFFSLYVHQTGSSGSLQLSVDNVANTVNYALGPVVPSVSDAAGVWRRLVVQVPLPSDTQMTIKLRLKLSGVSSSFTTDAWQFEVAGDQFNPAVGIYTDGDRPGCYWLSTPHNSVSIRPLGAWGGTRLDLETVGLVLVQGQSGTGYTALENTLAGFGQGDGAYFQRTSRKTRYFTLKLWQDGTDLPNLLLSRETLARYLKPGSMISFVYKGGTVPIAIDTYYESGFDFQQTQGPGVEQTVIRFVAPNPLWYSLSSVSYDLNPGAQITWNASTSSVYARTPARGKLPFAPSSDQSQFVALAGLSGKIDQFALHPTTGELWAVGTFANAGLNRVARFDSLTNTWTAINATGLTAEAKCIAFNRTGTRVCIGGTFTSKFIIGANVAGVWTFYAPAVNPNGDVNAVVYDDYQDAFFLGGAFTTMNSTTVNRVACVKLSGTTIVYVSISTSLNNTVFAMATQPNGQILIGGDYTADGATTVRRIGLLSPVTLATMTEVGGGVNNTVSCILVTRDARTFIGGLFTANPAGTTNLRKLAQLVGSLWAETGGGVYPAALGGVTCLAADSRGYLYVGAQLANIPGGSSNPVGTIPMPSGINGPGVWTGSAWGYLNFAFSTVATISVSAFFVKNDDTLYLGFDAENAIKASHLGSVSSGVTTRTKPTLRIHGPALIYALVNHTTGEEVYFQDLSLLAGETITIDFNDPIRRILSNIRGFLYNKYLTGFATNDFSIVPGVNYLSQFILVPNSISPASTSALASGSGLEWFPRFEGVEGAMHTRSTEQ